MLTEMLCGEIFCAPALKIYVAYNNKETENKVVKRIFGFPPVQNCSQLDVNYMDGLKVDEIVEWLHRPPPTYFYTGRFCDKKLRRNLILNEILSYAFFVELKDKICEVFFVPHIRYVLSPRLFTFWRYFEKVP